MRRLIPAAAVVLLTTVGCSSPTSAPSASAPKPSSAPPSSDPTATTSSSPPAPREQVAIPAAELPYKPVAGAPALDDVSIIKTASDPCTIAPDDSGDEAQLLNAQMDANVLIVTFEFTNPCASALTYHYTVTQAIGSANGPSGGPSTQAGSPVIQPGKSISFQVNVDPKPSLSTADLQRLWVGVTHITKTPAL